MTVRRWCVLLLVLAGLAGVALQVPAQAGDDKVVWKAFDKKVYKDGYYQTLTTKTNQIMKVMGQELKQEQEQTFFISWVPEDVDAKANWVVKQKIIGVKMKINIGGNQIDYDSIPVGQAQNPLSDFFQKLEKLELKFTINPKDMKVESIGGREQFIEELAKVSPQMKPLLEKILSEKALISMADPTWAPFPKDGNMKPKGTWGGEKSIIDLGPIGSYETIFKYTVEGKEGKDDKIGVTSSLTYAKPTNNQGLPFIIKEGKLTGDGKGTVLFNRDKGRIDKSDMTMKLAGDLTIEVGGQSTVVNITQDQSASSVTSDTDPVAELRKKEKDKK